MGMGFGRADPAQLRLRTTLHMDTLQVSLRVKLGKASVTAEKPSFSFELSAIQG